MRILLLVLALPVAVTVHAADSDSFDMARLEHELRDHKYVRIGVAGRTYVAVKPRVRPEGLVFDRVESMVHRRPSITTVEVKPPVGPEGLEFDRVESMVLRRTSIAFEEPDAPPTPPIPWSRIERIESGEPARLRSTLVGASIGLVLGGLLGAGFALAPMEGYPDPDAAWKGALVVGGIFAVAGAGIGALLPGTRWKQVYPDPPEDRR